MLGFLLFLILSEVLRPSLTYASRVRRQTSKVRISAVGNTITLKFLQPDKDTKLEGYILGYGSSLFSKQLIQLPEDGEPYETEIDAEPKYLVAVQPANGQEVKKQCAGTENVEKPLHLVIGSVTSTSVMLSWGTLLNTLSSETNQDDCIEDGHYTVRYREKEPKKTWNYQTCPTTQTVIDQLNPGTPYEFGVRAESENISGTWSPPVTHNTAEIDIYTPMKPENIFKNPITESTQTFSFSLPVIQSRPAFLLKHPEPPLPTQRITQAKDNHKPLKPENPLETMTPITKSPQTFSPSVPVLHSVTQSTPASLLRHSQPPPIQRATQDIHKPLKPEKLYTENTRALSPSVTVVTPVVASPTSGLQHPEPLSTQREMLVLHSVTKSRPALLLRHSAPSPVPWVTLGTGSAGLRTSRPSEDLLFLTQTLTSTRTPLSNLKYTNSIQPHHSTKPPLLKRTEQPLYPKQSQTLASTVKGQLNVTQMKRTKLHNNSIASKFRATQIQAKTAKYPIKTARPRPPKPYTIYPKTSINHSQHSTTKSQLEMTQNWLTTLRPSATQSQPHAAQPKSFTTQSQLDITYSKVITTQSLPHTIQLKSITTQSLPHTIQLKSTTTQSLPLTIQLKSTTTQSLPHTIQLKSTTTQSLPHTIQLKSTTTQSLPHTIQLKSITTQSLPHKIQLKSTTTQSLPHTIQLKSITTHQSQNIHSNSTASKSTSHTTQTQSITTFQPHIIQPKPIKSESAPHTTKSLPNTVKNYQSTDQPQPTTILPHHLTAQPHFIRTQSQPHTMQSQPNRIQPKLSKPQSITNRHITKPQTKTMQPKLTTTTFKTKTKHLKPRPQQTYTPQQSISTQSSTAKSQDNFRSHQQHNYVMNMNFTIKPNTYYQVSTPLELLNATEFQQSDYSPTSATIKLSNTKTWQSKPKKPVQTPSEKSNTQNLPWGEKKPVNKKIPVSQMAPSQSMDGHQTKPVLVRAATNRNQGRDVSSPSAFVASTSASTITKRVSPVSAPNPIELPPTYLNISVKNPQVTHDEKHKGQLWNRRHKWNKKKPEAKKNKNQLNQVDKVKGGDKATDLKVVDALPILKPSTPPTTETYRKPTPTTMPFFAYNGSRFNMGDNSSVFSSVPISDLDPMGKKRFVAPHVVYQIDKPPEQPCSVTHSLSFFPDEDNNVTSITGPPRTPPTNLTVVTVEGCPSFVILDWETADNETTEYEVTSSVKSPSGRVVSVVKTNQTHTAVENLKPESSYEFTVTPKNELGSGPSSESVSFNTESADPRVSEVPTGKNAIWSSFTFKADSSSECTGTQYVKRTWYRKFVGIQLCNSLRYKIYLSDSLKGRFYNIGDETGYGEDHCQFVDSFLDGRTGGQLPPNQLPPKQGFFRAMRQEPVKFGKIGGSTQINYVGWYECGVPIPGSW